MKTSVRLRMGGLLAAAAVATGGLVAVDAGTAPAEAAVSCTISSPKTVRPGNTGSCVTLLQKVLGGLRPDGSFGSATTARVKDYQRAKGLSADGIVGSRTWSKIRAGMSGAGTIVSSSATANWYACVIVRGGQSIRYTVTNKRSTGWQQATIITSGSLANPLIRGSIPSKGSRSTASNPSGFPKYYATSATYVTYTGGTYFTNDSYAYDFPNRTVYRSWLRPCGKTSPVYW
ncbi:peptidoglycan-binding domain-containing protein [Nocardioides sp. NPDC023903]|uniref:peptidoglycan-binding domain-containing protein n=1 Tax=Nocardioides sp. NPDC023903 TaxID=3157195 RepID=UPI0033CC726C